MTEDAELLSRYSAEQSEAAFAEFTRRHVDLVYSAGLRLVHGDIESAQDITQQVFTEGARHAKRLARHPALVGWLYTTTRLMALRVNRTEQRRKAREQEATTMNELLHGDAPPADWDQLRPVLEEAMHELDEKDRHAVLLRFFQNQTLNQVGQALNLTENAARMRVERALERLRGKLARRGITTTAAALAAMVSAQAVQAAPAGFAAALSAAAIGASAVQASTLVALTKTLAMTTLQKTVVAAALAAAIGTGFYAFHQGSQLKAQVQTLEQQQAPLRAQLQLLEQERGETSNQLAALSEENARLKSSRTEAEILKLRGQVGTLRQQAAANGARSAQPAGGLAKMLSDPAMKEYMRKAMAEKMRSIYGDLIQELKLSPQQTEQFLQLLTEAGTKNLAQLTAEAQGSPAAASDNSAQDTGNQLRALLGDAGCVRFQEFSQETPARATLTLLNNQLGESALSEEQRAKLIQVIKTEPMDLTRGMLGGPDKAFLRSQADIDTFLQQVTDSNQRILQQAGSFLKPNQLTALDDVLTKAIDARKLQGAAFFQKH
ncbi:MAG TPA: sigma-70 family RNA polymerase sigma factor [Verrucomicrobiae bacterium]|nr:sigma-70 family RNA polymerase sigma factor [Verrucomicrobiae bacterium]